MSPYGCGFKWFKYKQAVAASPAVVSLKFIQYDMKTQKAEPKGGDCAPSQIVIAS